ncbi:MAG: Uma2 family endonuclease [Cyanobacteria bacterium J06614_10]
MTFTPIRYKTYLEYIQADIGPDKTCRLLSNGEVIQLPPEDDENIVIADEFAELIRRLSGNRKLVRTSSTEIQVHPVGDKCVNRIPDLVVLRPEHRQLFAKLTKSAILFEMPPPLLVAEIVSPGNDHGNNYRRDYDWKRQQYEWWQIPEYWIIDRHRNQVVIFTLQADTYQEQRYAEADIITSSVFPTLKIVTSNLLSGNLL